MAGERWVATVQFLKRMNSGRGYTANMARGPGHSNTKQWLPLSSAHIRRDAVGKGIAEAVSDIDYIKLQEKHRG